MALHFRVCGSRNGCFGLLVLYRSIAHEPALLTAEEFSQPYLHGRYFRISELADSNHVIEGRTFEDCYIYGPAVLFAHDNVDLQHSSFEGSKDEVFIPTIGGRTGPGSGVIVLKDCKFRRCHFIGVSFVANPQDVEKWMSSPENRTLQEQ